jgi:hypothetical protein
MNLPVLTFSYPTEQIISPNLGSKLIEPFRNRLELSSNIFSSVSIHLSLDTKLHEIIKRVKLI